MNPKSEDKKCQEIDNQPDSLKTGSSIAGVRKLNGIILVHFGKDKYSD